MDDKEFSNVFSIPANYTDSGKILGGIGAQVTVRIIGINRETNRIWGVITHTTTAI